MESVSSSLEKLGHEREENGDQTELDFGEGI